MYQNDKKHIKNYNFYKKILNFLGTRFTNV